MSQKRYKPEEIISKLREAEVLLGQGMSIELVLRSEATSQSSRGLPKD